MKTKNYSVFLATLSSEVCICVYWRFERVPMMTMVCVLGFSSFFLLKAAQASQDEQGELVTLTVTLVRLLVLRSSPRILKGKKDCLLSNTAVNIPYVFLIVC